MTLEEFEAALEADPEKGKAFEEALVGMKKDEVTSEAEAFSKAASAVGFQISPEEIERAYAARMEIDDSELESVVGAVDVDDDPSRSAWDSLGEDPIGHDNKCDVAWHCYYFALHTSEANTRTTCFSDYLCNGNYRTGGSHLCGKTHTLDDNCTLTWEHNEETCKLVWG